MEKIFILKKVFIFSAGSTDWGISFPETANQAK